MTQQTGKSISRPVQLAQLLSQRSPIGDACDDVQLDVVDDQVVGVLEHYGPAGTGWWMWRAVNTSEQLLLAT